MSFKPFTQVSQNLARTEAGLGQGRRCSRAWPNCMAAGPQRCFPAQAFVVYHTSVTLHARGKAFWLAKFHLVS